MTSGERLILAGALERRGIARKWAVWAADAIAYDEGAGTPPAVPGRVPDAQRLHVLRVAREARQMMKPERPAEDVRRARHGSPPVGKPTNPGGATA